jgi:hypothetical protein
MLIFLPIVAGTGPSDQVSLALARLVTSQWVDSAVAWLLGPLGQ